MERARNKAKRTAVKAPEIFTAINTSFSKALCRSTELFYSKKRFLSINNIELSQICMYNNVYLLKDGVMQNAKIKFEKMLDKRRQK